MNTEKKAIADDGVNISRLDLLLCIHYNKSIKYGWNINVRLHLSIFKVNNSKIWFLIGDNILIIIQMKIYQQ